MRALIILLFVGLYSILSFSQSNRLYEEVITLNEKPAIAWVTVMEQDMDFSRKQFIQFAKENYHAKAKRSGKRMVWIEQADIPAISSQQGDLWVVFFPENESVRMAVAYVLGYDIVLNSRDYPVEMENLRQFSKAFVFYNERADYRDRIETDKKRVKRLTASQKKNRKLEKRMVSRIPRLERKILSVDEENKKLALTQKSVEAKSRLEATREMLIHRGQELKLAKESLRMNREALRKIEAAGWK